MGNCISFDSKNDDDVVICVHCGRKEYYGKMKWMSGWRGCRDCYKKKYKEEIGTDYPFDDLEGERP